MILLLALSLCGCSVVKDDAGDLLGNAAGQEEEQPAPTAENNGIGTALDCLNTSEPSPKPVVTPEPEAAVPKAPFDDYTTPDGYVDITPYLGMSKDECDN